MGHVLSSPTETVGQVCVRVCVCGGEGMGQVAGEYVLPSLTDNVARVAGEHVLPSPTETVGRVAGEYVLPSPTDTVGRVAGEISFSGMVSSMFSRVLVSLSKSLNE